MSYLETWKREEQIPFAGWDFSHLAGRYYTEKPPWSYEAHVREAMAKAASVLDIGTGGGEKLTDFKDVFPARVVATDFSERFLELAAARSADLSDRISYHLIDATDEAQLLSLGAGRFDAVLGDQQQQHGHEGERPREDQARADGADLGGKGGMSGAQGIDDGDHQEDDRGDGAYRRRRDSPGKARRLGSKHREMHDNAGVSE